MRHVLLQNLNMLFSINGAFANVHFCTPTLHRYQAGGLLSSLTQEIDLHKQSEGFSVFPLHLSPVLKEETTGPEEAATSLALVYIRFPLYFLSVVTASPRLLQKDNTSPGMLLYT